MESDGDALPTRRLRAEFPEQLHVA
ncbi:MAG: hypothetical protein RLZZ467_811, partial [Gemmatimonadota bacterium]